MMNAGRRIPSLSTNSAVRRLLSTVSETPKKPFRPVRKVRGRRPVLLEQEARNAQLEEKALKENLPWRIVGSVVLHRYPVITPDLEQWEIDFENLKNKKQEMHGETHEDVLLSLPFEPAPRVTEADKTDNRRSVERKLQESLFLVVKRNRENYSWQFPQGKWLEGETLRQTSERVLKRAIGEVSYYPIGNFPVGHYLYEYPEEMKQQRKAFGAKIFFHRIGYTSGDDFKFETRLYKDYVWVTRSELGEYFDEETAKYMQFMVPY
eukprot:scaffold7012_cov166-Ochromonas_danica.AAC.8